MMSATLPEPSTATMVHPCSVLTAAGEPVTEGLAILIPRADGLEARLTALTAPGSLLNLHYGKGMRRFLLTMDAQPPRPADLLITQWQGAGSRVARFHLSGAA